MFDWKKLSALLLIVLVVCAPLVLRERNGAAVPQDGAEVLTIITAHNEMLRNEYAIGFRRWFMAKTGRNVAIDWRYQGGGKDAVRYVESLYANAFRLHWTNDLKQKWDSGIAAAFAARSENFLDSLENSKFFRRKNDSTVAKVSEAFFNSNVGCGMDILFGGGAYECEMQAANGNLIPCGFIGKHPEIFCDGAIPEFLAGVRMWDDGDRWFGCSLSSMVIIYNGDAIAEDGLQFFPETWMDLGRPELFGKLTIADPTKSSSTQKALSMLIQQQMQIRYEEALGNYKSQATDRSLSATDLGRVISDGWMDGLRLIQKIVANGRSFADSSMKSVSEVSMGNCLAGFAIDFYGLAEAKHLKKRCGSSRFRLAMPRGGGAPSPDPIGIFRGAPNRELAEAFVEFILSINGQKLMDFRVGVEGGPEKTTMGLMPIVKAMYDPQYKPYRCDQTLNPYEAAKSFLSHEDWIGEASKAIGFISKLAFIDLNRELSEAMGAIVRARKECRDGDGDAAYALLSNLQEISLKAVLETIVPTIKSKDALKISRLRGDLRKKFMSRYLRAKNIANGGK